MKSDVWSLGISLVELAIGAFPFSDPPDDDDCSDLEDYPGHTLKTPTHRDSFMVSQKTVRRASKRKSKITLDADGGLTSMSIIELMHQIVQEPSPRLPEDQFPIDAVDFVDDCLLKDPGHRQTPKVLIVSPVEILSRLLRGLTNAQIDDTVDEHGARVELRHGRVCLYDLITCLRLHIISPPPITHLATCRRKLN